MTVAVVVPCRNESLTITDVLDAVLAQHARPDEIVIVDDGSTDGTAEVVERWADDDRAAQVRLIRGAGRGAGAAMNTGIATSSADVIVRLDGHCVPAPDYVRRSLDALEQPRAGVVGGVWDIAAGAPTRTARAIAAAVSHPAGSGGAAYRHAGSGGPERESVETVPFGTFRRELWERLGGFDESLMANQDFDFNYRTRLSGLDVVLDRRIRCTYRARPTLRALARQYHRYGFWKWRMLRKNPKALHWRQVPPALVAPWIAVSAAAAVVSGDPLACYVVLMYPAAVAAAGAHAALRMADPAAWPLTIAAFLTVHVSWSTGFWRALLGVAPPK